MTIKIEIEDLVLAVMKKCINNHHVYSPSEEYDMIFLAHLLICKYARNII